MEDLPLSCFILLEKVSEEISNFSTSCGFFGKKTERSGNVDLETLLGEPRPRDRANQGVQNNNLILQKLTNIENELKESKTTQD
jgi:hypothetical protein